MNLKIPENCGLCASKHQFGEIFICNAPVSKEKEILDITAFEVDLSSRPEWCPVKKLIDEVENWSEKNKILFNKMCEGFSAMFELINNQRGKEG